MARSVTRIILSELKKAETAQRRRATQLERERNRVIREQNRIRKAQQSERAKMQKINKERYIADQIQQAEEMTGELLHRHEKYNTLVASQLVAKDTFDFDSLKKNYVETKFRFSEKEPMPQSPIIEIAKLTPVPKESWLETIFPSKKEFRLSVLSENEKQLEDIKVINQHNAELAEANNLKRFAGYEHRKNMAEKEHEQHELAKKESINIHNEEIDLWYTDYMAGDSEAINAYVDMLFTKYNYALDTIADYKIGYNIHLKKLIVDLYLAERDEIFEGNGYKYIKQRDEFEPIKFKVSELTERMRNLMVEICMATFLLLFRNDTCGHLESVVINVFNNRICCVSGSVEKEVFLKHNFALKSGKDAFLELQMRVFKQITRGVKPFELLFATLE